MKEHFLPMGRSDLGSTQESRWRRIIITSGAGLALIASGVVMVRTFWPPMPGHNRDQFTGLGQALAVETAKVLHDHGRVVVIRASEHAMDNLPENDTWRAFCTEMERHPSIRVVATVVVNSEPPMEYGLTRARLDSILEQQPEIDGVVSLYGIAECDPRRPFELPRKNLKIIVVQPNPVPIKPYFANGLLAVAIVRRENPASDLAKPRTPAGWFARSYQVFTVGNYQSLPDEEVPQ